MKKKTTFIVAVMIIVLGVATVVGVNDYRAEKRKLAAEQQVALAKGKAYYDRGHYPEALETLSRIDSAETDDWRVPFYKGATLVRLKDYQAAARELEEARRLNSTDTQTLYLLGVVYFKLGKLKLSEGYFSAVLEIDPNHVEAKGLMGVMSDLQKQQEKPDSGP